MTIKRLEASLVAACGALTDLPVSITEAIIKKFIHDHVTVASELSANLKAFEFVQATTTRERERTRQPRTHGRSETGVVLFFSNHQCV